MTFAVGSAGNGPGGRGNDDGGLMRNRGRSIVVALVLASAVLGMSGCGAPPALTKAQLDAKKLPQRHPNLSATQKQNCRSCHREAPPIKKQP
jgi:hypothetical protein